MRDSTPRDPALVAVSTPGATGEAETATGFAVGPARVVTVAHVLESGHPLAVRDGAGALRRARVVRVDPAADLALVAVSGLAAPRLREAAAGESDAHLLVRRGGRATSLPAEVRRRITATVRRPGLPPRVRPALELRVRVAPGDSGAPVLDRHGALAGVIFARASSGRDSAYAVDADAVSALLR
jgi:S1-C subfamily serine protease